MKKFINTQIFYESTDKLIKLINSNTGEWNILPKEQLIDFPNNTSKNDILSLFTQTKSEVEKPSDDIINLIIIDITDSCNLKCNYCSVNATSVGSFININDLKDGLSTIFKLPNLGKLVTIEFSGGEPLLGFQKIKQIVNLINNISRKHCINIRYSIQTNGTLINDENSAFLYENNFSIGISIDGLESSNKNRVFPNGESAYHKIINSFSILRRNGIKQFSTLGVVSKPEQYQEYLDFVLKYNIKDFRLNNLSNIGRSITNLGSIYNESDIDVFVTGYIEMAKKLILNPLYSEFREANLEYYLWSLLDWQPHMCFRTPCGSGRNQLHINSLGKIFPCQDWRSIGDAEICEIKSKNLEENLENNFRVKEMKKSNFDRYPELCMDCEWKYRCGVCSRELHTEYNRDSKKIGLCLFQNKVYSNLLEIIYYHQEDVLKYLRVF